MEQGKLIMLIISSSLLFLFAVPFIVRLTRQVIAIKRGRKYLSDRVSNDNSGRLFVEWSDENGKKHNKIFSVICQNYSSLTEVTIYSYRKMLSLGKMSVLSDAFFILVEIVAMIYLAVYAVINL